MKINSKFVVKSLCELLYLKEEGMDKWFELEDALGDVLAATRGIEECKEEIGALYDVVYELQVILNGDNWRNENDG